MKSQQPTRDGLNVSVSQLQKPRTIAQLDCHVAKENGTLVSMVPCAQSHLSRFLLQNLRSDAVSGPPWYLQGLEQVSSLLIIQRKFGFYI